MPSVSQAQQMYLAMELKAKQQGMPTNVHMTEKQMEAFAGTKRKGLPKRKKKK